jgi:hypothetical protein
MLVNGVESANSKMAFSAGSADRRLQVRRDLAEGEASRHAGFGVQIVKRGLERGAIQAIAAKVEAPTLFHGKWTAR